jgi:hypothetical protein
MIEASERAKAAIADLEGQGQTGQPLQQMSETADHLQKAVDNDDFWATLLVKPRELPSAGKVGRTNDGLNIAHAVEEATLKSARAILFLHVDPLVQAAEEPKPVEA